MRKDLPYKNVRTLIEICYVCVTNLLHECINLATTRQGICKKNATFWHARSVSKAFIYLTKDFYIENE